MCEATTNLARCWSFVGSISSRTTHRMSKRDIIGSDRFTWKMFIFQVELLFHCLGTNIKFYTLNIVLNNSEL